MFRIKLLILLLTSFLSFSCTKDITNKNNIKYSIGYIGGEYDGLILKNSLVNNLSSLDLYSDGSIYELRPSISHKTNLFITNIDNTSDRMELQSELNVVIIDQRFNCAKQNFKESVSQFYIFAESDKYISNNRAEKKIKEDNTDALVKEFINKLKKSKKICIGINE